MSDAEYLPGQVLPPTPEGILKICVDVSFKNTSLHEESGQMISAPPDQPDQGQHPVPDILKEECLRVVKGIYGNELPDVKFEWYRICWYESAHFDISYGCLTENQGCIHAQSRLHNFSSSSLQESVHCNGWFISWLEVPTDSW
jgi:hypothetical protein